MVNCQIGVKCFSGVKDHKQQLFDGLTCFAVRSDTPICYLIFFKLRFTPCKADQLLGDMELKETEVQKD